MKRTYMKKVNKYFKYHTDSSISFKKNLILVYDTLYYFFLRFFLWFFFFLKFSCVLCIFSLFPMFFYSASVMSTIFLKCLKIQDYFLIFKLSCSLSWLAQQP